MWGVVKLEVISRNEISQFHTGNWEFASEMRRRISQQGTSAQAVRNTSRSIDILANARQRIIDSSRNA
jgi:hypothetical protein